MPHELILKPEEYADSHLTTIWEQLAHRVEVQPLNLLFFILFVLAITHTFVAHRFSRLANKKERITSTESKIGIEDCRYRLDGSLSHHSKILPEIFDFLGELEVVMGFWCIPLLLVMTLAYDWETTLHYINSHNYNEALFMIVAMSIAATYPITHLAELCLKKVAVLRNESPTIWWWLIMTIGPLLGSLIKETVAIAISSVLLAKYFFQYRPTTRLAYGTFGLLLVNISVGGTLTYFATSAVAIAAKPWGWSSAYMLFTFGWKAIIGILINNSLYYFFFYKDFVKLDKMAQSDKALAKREIEKKVPIWITLVHVFMIWWLSINNQNTVIALGSFVLFLGFYQATAPYQTFMNLRDPIMVGFFIASVILLGGVQIWWVGPILKNLNELVAMKVTIFLSAFVHNTTIAYMITKISDLTDAMKYALFSGVIIGGGLTMIGNGPNLVAYSLLKKDFHYRINLGWVFIAALIPTLIMYLCFSFLFIT